MKLKYIVVCDEHGNKTEPILHYWNKDANAWEVVQTVEVKEWEYDEYIFVE